MRAKMNTKRRGYRKIHKYIVCYDWDNIATLNCVIPAV